MTVFTFIPLKRWSKYHQSFLKFKSKNNGVYKIGYVIESLCNIKCIMHTYNIDNTNSYLEELSRMKLWKGIEEGAKKEKGRRGETKI